jgi:DNA-binding transcriptional regulator YiaG
VYIVIPSIDHFNAWHNKTFAACFVCALERNGKNMKRKIPTINMVKTGQNILHLREQAGLSVKELQEIFGFATPQAIYKWQRGTAMPTVDNLVVLAAVFNVPLDNILVVEETMQVQILSA